MVQSVKRAMDILTVLSDARGGAVPLEQIALATGLNKSTCVRLLGTLREDGFAQHVSSREGYQLGPLAYYLTRYGKYQQSLIELCHPVLRWLNRETGQTVLLTMVYDDRKLVIHRIEGEKKLGPEKGEMILGDLMGTASGRILMAHLSRRERLSFYRRNGLPAPGTWHGADSVDAVERMLDAYRRQGYAIVRAQHSEHVTELGYACEIHNREGSVGAIAIAAPDEYDGVRIAPATHQLILQKLLAAAREINRRITLDMQDAHVSG